MAQAPTTTYPTGRHVSYNLGTGMHDLTPLLNGAGFTASTVTATAGGTRPPATPLTAAINLIAVCATAGDSVMLPPATGGQLMWISNAGAASAQIFAAAGTTDTINGVAAATGIALAAGKSDVIMSPLAGAWFTVLSA
jgi:hypothetical protein